MSVFRSGASSSQHIRMQPLQWHVQLGLKKRASHTELDGYGKEHTVHKISFLYCELTKTRRKTKGGETEDVTEESHV